MRFSRRTIRSFGKLSGIFLTPTGLFMYGGGIDTACAPDFESREK